MKTRLFWNGAEKALLVLAAWAAWVVPAWPISSPLPTNQWQLTVTVPVEATVQSSPPRITLRAHKTERSYQVFRKGPHDLTWSSQIGTIPAGSGVWTDTNVVVGQEYEYRLSGGTTVGRSRSDARLYGYIRSGIDVDQTGWRGRVALVVEDRVRTNMAAAIQRYIEDLTGDGWTVHMVSAPRGTGYGGMDGAGFLHVPVRNQILALYTNYPGQVKHVALLGNVPQPRTGLTYYGPDGHGNKAAFGADCYYADMNGTWTDTGYNTATGAMTNAPGDGKYDQTRATTSDWNYFELGFGRMDMPFLSEGPLLGLQNYLDKLHRYKHAAPDFRPGWRGLIREGFDNVSETGWNSMSALLGLDNIEYIPGGIFSSGGLDYDQMYSAGYGPYLFYCKGNSGPERGVGGRAVIWTGLQSGWGYWYEHSAMGNALAEDSFTLSYTWSAWGWRYFYHRLGLGDVMGDMMRVSINNRGWYSADGLHRMDSYYWPNGDHTGAMFMNHLGDPLLRLYMFPPARNLAAAPSGGGVRLSWDASEDPAVAGYHVYRSTAMDQPFTRLTASPITATSYTDTGVASGAHIYMVRAVKLETTASGTFWNGSQGIFRSINLDTAPPALQVATTNLPAAFFDSPYDAQLAGAGGYPRYVWSVQGGALPDGVQLSAEGRLTGTPKASGAFPITVAATDAAGTVATRALTLTVNAGRQLAFAPSADAYVLSVNPMNNYGASRVLVPGQGHWLGSAYLRFACRIPTNLTTVARATLRLWPSEQTGLAPGDGVQAALVEDDTWVEGTGAGTASTNSITWDLRPADSTRVPPVSRSDAPTFGAPYDLDVTSLVNADLQNDPTGTVSLRVGVINGWAQLFQPSRESLMQKYVPQLILEYGAGPRLELATPAGGHCRVAPGREAWLSANVTHPTANPSTLALAWSVVRQPAGASAQFSAPSSAQTAVSFDREGTYVLRLTASDGAQSASVDATVEVSAVQMPAGPPPEIAHYPFDEDGGNVAHNRASGPDGTLANFNGTNAWSISGKIGGALDFAADSGSSRAHVVALPHAAYDFNPNRPWTVSLWVKLTQGNIDVAGKAVAALAEKQLRLTPEGGNQRTAFTMGGSVQTMNFNERAINDGQWRMMTVVNDPSQKMAFGFVDGGLGGVRMITPGTETTTADFLIGTVRNANNTDTAGDFDGQIDDVRVYDRALSFAEVRQLYQAEPLNCAPIVSFTGATNLVHPGVPVMLAGAASDDGLPAGGVLTYQWEKVSGPGSVVFGSSNAPLTSATFSAAGEYAVRLTASDGNAAASATLAVHVYAPGDPAANQAPAVEAGPDRQLTGPGTVMLAGSASDDGRPNPPGGLSYAWRQVSGPGVVAFGNAGQTNTTARLPGYGVYVLELAASDGALTGSDTVRLEIAAEPNAPPAVDAGTNGVALINVPYSLRATASDDGRPNPPGALTYRWSKLTGPGTAVFSSASVLNPAVTFNAVGEYVLWLAASDGEFTLNDFVTVTCVYDDAGNAAPVVDLGPDREISLPETLFLDITATDDGLPNPPGILSFAWEKVSGPGAVAMEQLDGNTRAALSFERAGAYELCLTADDGARRGSDTVWVTAREGSAYRQVWSWGRNNRGQLGPFERLQAMAKPYRVEYNWQSVGGADNTTVARRFDGRVVGSGENPLGLLGGTNSEKHYFSTVPHTSNALAVASSDYAFAALRPDGSVWTWGTAEYGQLGDGSTTNRTVPKMVPGLSNITDIFGRNNGFMARDQAGRVWAWGRNSNGRFGIGNTANLNLPLQVPGLSNVTQIAMPEFHTLFLKEDGTVWACGYNGSGQIGDGTTGVNRYSPVQVLISTNPVTPLTGVRKVAAGMYHSLALDDAGQVWAWGYNLYGPVGDGTSTNRNLAQRVLDPASPGGFLTNASDIACCDVTSYALKKDGTVVGWGSGGSGAFGSAPGTTNRYYPEAVQGLPPNIRAIWAGGESAFAVTAGMEFPDFVAANFTPEEIAGGRTGPEADFDGDGHSNLVEWILKMNPKRANPPAWEVRKDGADFVFRLEHLDVAEGVTVELESSQDQEHWASAQPDSVELVEQGDSVTKTFRFGAKPGQTRLFLRVRVARKE